MDGVIDIKEAAALMKQGRIVKLPDQDEELYADRRGTICDQSIDTYYSLTLQDLLAEDWEEVVND